MTANNDNQIYHFGNFSLTIRDRAAQLSRRGRSMPLTPKASQILAMLIENRGRVVSREQLLETVWDNCFVEENSLTKNISILRKTLGDNAPFAPRFIETVSRRGYRFIAQVRTLVENNSETAARTDLRALAVLPFKVFGAAIEAGFLGLGLADILITRLSNLPSITVRPTGAVRKYELSEREPSDIGRELNVEWVLDGCLFQSGARVRATVQFVNVREGHPLWGERLDVESEDLIGIQDQLAERIARILIDKLKIDRTAAPRPQPTINDLAFKEYLEGRFYWNKRTAESMRKAAECFRRAIAAAPQFALAHAGLGDALLLFNQYGLLTPRETFMQSKSAAGIALEIATDLGEPHATLAHVAFLFEWDWQTAEHHYRRAIELSPNYATAHHWYALFLRAMNRFDEAISEIRAALEIDPLSPVILKNFGTILMNAGRFGEAETVARKAVELEPNFALAHRTLGWIYLQSGALQKAINAMETAARLAPDDPAVICSLSYTYAKANRRAEALRVLSELREIPAPRHVSKYDIAQIFLALWEVEKALELLDEAYNERDFSITLLAVDPDFNSLRSAPRFQELLKRVNLIEASKR